MHWSPLFLLIFVLSQLAFFSLGILLYEGGRFIFAILLGVPVLSFSFGAGNIPIYARRVRDTWVFVYRQPFFSRCRVYYGPVGETDGVDSHSQFPMNEKERALAEEFAVHPPQKLLPYVTLLGGPTAALFTIIAIFIVGVKYIILWKPI